MAVAVAGGATPATATMSGGQRWVALATGDRVRLDPVGSRYEVRAAPGREQLSYHTVAVDGHRYVVSPAGNGRLGSRRLRAGVSAVALDAAHPPRPAAAEEEAEVTFVYRDRDGAAAADASTFLFGPNGFLAFVAPGPDGTATVRMPRGHYLVDTQVNTPRPGKDAPSTSGIVNPDLTVEDNARVVVDAAVAKPVSVSMPDPKAIWLDAYVSYRISLNGATITGSVRGPDVTALYVAHDGPTVPDDTVQAAVTVFFARPGPTGTLVDSPVTYAAAWEQKGRYYTGFRKRVNASELSTVRAEHAATVPGRRAAKSMVAELFSSDRIDYELEYTAAPFTRVEHYAGTAKWANVLREFAPGDPPDPWNRIDLTSQTQAPTAYGSGCQLSERWNLAPFWPDPQARRYGDTISATPALYSDQDGRRTGLSPYQRAHVALYRNGDLIGESDQLGRSEHRVPADASTYRLTIEAERGLTELASRVSGTWTFTSAHAEGTGEPLGLLTVRFAPPVDLDGRAPGGPSMPMPVYLEGHVRSFTLQASFDAGTTWQPVQVTGTGSTRPAIMRHPAGPGLVSLRATATDTRGNTVEQTIVSAYRL